MPAKPEYGEWKVSKKMDISYFLYQELSRISEAIPHPHEYILRVENLAYFFQPDWDQQYLQEIQEIDNDPHLKTTPADDDTTALEKNYRKSMRKLGALMKLIDRLGYRIERTGEEEI